MLQEREQRRKSLDEHITAIARSSVRFCSVLTQNQTVSFRPKPCRNTILRLQGQNPLQAYCAALAGNLLYLAVLD